MTMFRVVIEGFGEAKEVEFEANNAEEAEEIGKDIFFEECNYGVSKIPEKE